MNFDLYNRVKYFDQPFAYILLNYRVENYCSYCLRKPTGFKLLFCGQCRFARYCDKNCQKLGSLLRSIEQKVEYLRNSVYRHENKT
uniref:MYND-type domain-containing protein n=1 Tax=Romanomermis culicivorax TaxID=13658 RepID=A0A915LBL0_ROMCU